MLIPVGGTICSAKKSEGTLSVSEKAGSLLKSYFENSDSVYASKCRIDIGENLFILSENMTVDKWNLIIESYRKNVLEKDYDGVIIAHGTDTLAYSAALFSMLLCGCTIPVFFVSANKSLASDCSNGNANFRCAAECICREISPNVYVPYQNPSDGRMYLHLASRITQCQNYSEDFFSRGAIDMTEVTEKNYAEVFAGLNKLYPADKRKPFFDISEKTVLKDCVLKIEPYVGINYDAYDYSKFSAVLHGSYHSGTACVQKTMSAPEYGKESVLHMIDICTSLTPAVDTYISPSKLTGDVYETTAIFANHKGTNGKKAKLIYGYTAEMAYAKLVIAYSLLEAAEDRKLFINSECNFEIIA